MKLDKNKIFIDTSIHGSLDLDTITEILTKTIEETGFYGVKISFDLRIQDIEDCLGAPPIRKAVLKGISFKGHVTPTKADTCDESYYSAGEDITCFNQLLKYLNAGHDVIITTNRKVITAVEALLTDHDTGKTLKGWKPKEY